MTPPDWNQEVHCRRLGHTVPLAYCAEESIDLPCRLIYQCWDGRIAVHDFLLTRYSEPQLQALQQPGASKLCAIVRIIDRAREP